MTTKLPHVREVSVEEVEEAEGEEKILADGDPPIEIIIGPVNRIVTEAGAPSNLITEIVLGNQTCSQETLIEGAPLSRNPLNQPKRG